MINTPQIFDTPSGSPVRGFSDQLRSFATGTPTPESGTGPKSFSTPSGSPVAGYSGQLRIH